MELSRIPCISLGVGQGRFRIVQELRKTKGQSSHIKDYRDVSLADCCGKLFKRHVRHEIRPHLETYTLQTMCGGFLRRGCDLRSHFNRTIVSIAEVRKISAAT